MAPPSVLLIGPQDLRLTVLDAVLQSLPDVVMLGYASDAESIPKCVSPWCPDVVLAGWSEPRQSTSSLIRALKSRGCCPIFILIGPNPSPVELLLLRALGI